MRSPLVALTTAEVQAIVIAAKEYRRYANEAYAPLIETRNGLSSMRFTPESTKIMDQVDASQERARFYGLVEALLPEARHELTAIMWIGRGDGDASDFALFKKEARRQSNAGNTAYLCEKSPLPEYLRKGLVELGA